MQVHRINKNTIQVNLDAEELKERGITMLDLLGNKSQIQKFFYQILSEVDTDHSFAQDEPVTFQVMPSGSGLELLISKVSDDTDDDEDDNSQLKQLLKGLVNAHKDDIFNTQKDSKEVPNRLIYKIRDISDVVGLADALRIQGLASSLYTYDHEYYIDLAFLDDNYIEMKPEDAWVIANEFGVRMTEKEFSKIKRRSKMLIEQDALGNLRNYFIKSK